MGLQEILIGFMSPSHLTYFFENEIAQAFFLSAIFLLSAFNYNFEMSCKIVALQRFNCYYVMFGHHFELTLKILSNG